MITVGELVREGREQLRRSGLDAAGREAALLLGALLAWSEARVLAHDGDPVPAGTERRFRSLLDRRRAGEPVAYLLGEREFFGRPFTVDSRVLIPRPETEQLVELALAARLPARARALDIGTGSGCLAVTLAAERPAWTVVATDLSIPALDVARANARRHQVDDRVHCVAADLCSGLDLGSFDVVVGNPPYVEEGVVPFLSRDVRDFEPRVALVGGSGGLETMAHLLDQLTALRAGVWVALEFGFGQAVPVATLVAREDAFDAIEIRTDLAGIERNVVFKRRG
jgi:release factor glutamine methyltransferase